MPIDTVVSALTARFGERVSTSAAVREQHGSSEAHHVAALPDAVFWPQSTQEVAFAVSICAASGVPVIAFGAGTSLEGHVAAVNGGLTIDLSRMNEVLEVHAEDLDCVVQAGVTRKQLDQYLRDVGLFFPIDPGADATIGGMVATRASGTNAVRYGTMRENVLSLTVVLADGTVIRTGSRARKSSAGYDLTRVFTGSEGTLGIVTEVTLRLHGIPETIQAAICTFPSIESAVDAAIAVVQFGVPIAKMELLDIAAIEAINRHVGSNHEASDTIFLEFHGAPQAVAEQVETVRQIAKGNGGSAFRWAASQEERTTLWKARHEAYYSAVAMRPGARGWATDVCVPVSNMAESIAATKTLLASSSVPAAIMGHVGDGNYHVVFALDPNSPEERAELQRINAAMIERAIALDGTCTGEHGIGLGKLAYMTKEHGEAIEVMRRIKNALDPNGLLNPGKVLPRSIEDRR